MNAIPFSRSSVQNDSLIRSVDEGYSNFGLVKFFLFYTVLLSKLRRFFSLVTAKYIKSQSPQYSFKMTTTHLRIPNYVFIYYRVIRLATATLFYKLSVTFFDFFVVNRPSTTGDVARRCFCLCKIRRVPQTNPIKDARVYLK